jgi:carbamoylphosphate synthase large subunit
MKIAFIDTGTHNTFLYTNLKENMYDVVKIKSNSLNNIKVDFVYPAFSDFQLSWITQYNINNNIIGIKQKTADSIKTKDLYYKIFNELNIPCPKVYGVIKCDKNLLYNIPKDIIYPCIVKPSDGTAGCDVYIASSCKDLILFLSRRFFFQGMYYNKSVIIQEYVEGSVVSIVGRILNNEIKVDMFYDIECNSFPYPIETASVYPSKHNHKLADIVNHLKKFISYIELNNYPFMLDVIVADDVYFIDFGARASFNPQFLIWHGGEKNYGIKLLNSILYQQDFEMDPIRPISFKVKPTEQILKHDNDVFKIGYDII